MKRTIKGVVAVAACLGMGAAPAAAAGWDSGIPGQSGARYDADGNGSPDAGVAVTGYYNEYYSYDADGGYYWDRGFGRVLGNVGSVDELDAATLTTCTYGVHYRGTFENDPYQDSGWISNTIRCEGAEAGSFLYLIVHESDPRYTGEGTPIWGEWEYHVNAASGTGNVERHVRQGITG